MLGMKKSLVGNREAHEILEIASLSGRINLLQHDVWDLTWCHQIDRWELMMKCQCKNSKRHMFQLHTLRRVKRFHQMFLWPRLNQKIQCRQLPCVAFCSNVLQIRWTVWSHRNVTEVTMMIILHFIPLIIMIWRMCQKFWKMGRVSSVEQGCLTCWTVVGMRLNSRLEHRKTKHWQKHSPLNFCRKKSTICLSRSVFRWTKKQYNKSATIPIQKQPSVWWSDGDVQKRKCQLCQLNRNVSLSQRKTRNSARLSNILWSKRHHVKGSHRLRWWKCAGLWRSKMMDLWKHERWCKVLQTEDLARIQRLLQPHPVDLVRVSWHLPHHLVFKLTKGTWNAHFFMET